MYHEIEAPHNRFRAYLSDNMFFFLLPRLEWNNVSFYVCPVNVVGVCALRGFRICSHGSILIKRITWI